jgi:hypothetical protein
MDKIGDEELWAADDVTAGGRLSWLKKCMFWWSS